MAGDWIKMRVWLSRDPKVIWMADHLASDRAFMDWLTDPVRQRCDESAYEHVTRHVTRALAVTGLLQVWGTAREQGRRDGDDLVIDHCDYSSLDEIADIPGFGEAMGAVGWATETEDGRVILPKFFLDKESTADRHKSASAERSARYRDRKRSKRDAGGVTDHVTDHVTRDVIVTHRGEERRGEETPPTPSRGETLAEIRSEKRTMPSDHPELAVVATRIGKHYMTVVQPAHTLKNACQVILQLLLAGKEERQLCTAADGYAVWCREHGREASKREAVYTFYGPEGSHGQFLDWQPPPPPPRYEPPKPNGATMTPEEAREWSARRKAKKGVST